MGRKFRGAKAQLELNPAIAVEGAIKCSSKYIGNERRAEESVHSLLHVRRNSVTEDEEKAEVLSGFSASIVRPVVQQVPRPLSWRTGIRSRMKFP